VDKRSATLGLAGHREEAIGIEADHRRICKFGDPKNPTYQQVEDNIVRLAKKAVQRARYGPISIFRRDSTMPDFRPDSTVPTFRRDSTVPTFRRSSTFQNDYKPPGPVCK
jgi:hypothetical protein